MTRREVIQSGVATILLGGIEAVAQPVKSAIGAAQIRNVVSEDEEEKMYKELFLAAVGKTLAGDLVLPEVEYVGRTGFGYNSSLTGLVLPNCTSASDLCPSCANLLNFSAPKLLTVPSGSLSYCTNLEEAHFDSATTIQAQTFNASPKLKRIYCPNLQVVSGAWCNGNAQLTDVYVTNRTTAQVLAISGFPGFVNMDAVRGNITWHCSDGIITWDGSAWVATPNA